MATVEEHGCGWGMLRLRANGWDRHDQGQSSAELWVDNRILMESLSAVPWHRPALEDRNRVALFPPRRPFVSSQLKPAVRTVQATCASDRELLFTTR
jgi:hypothetical protein